LSYLGEGRFDAKLLLDPPEGHPTDVNERRESVDANDTLSVRMSRGGGFVATLRPE
jgi:hypothetical protein